MTNVACTFFSENLICSRSRIANEDSYEIHLDKNESPFGIDDHTKQLITNELIRNEWNRYPPANQHEIESLIAKWQNVSSENIVVAPGAANIIISLLSYFSISKKTITIIQPSYALFDYYCKTYGINYQTWFLSQGLEYDISSLPPQNKGSVVFIASPNNPVGNVISHSQMALLLNQFPHTLFVVDEVYVDFSCTNFQHFIFKYPNLILIRSFSKAMPAAGIRLGYLICRPEIAAQIRKLILSFSLNYFSLAFAQIVLSNHEIIKKFKTNVDQIIQERERLINELRLIATQHFTVYNSSGNFIMVKFTDQSQHTAIGDLLKKQAIKTLDTSNMPLLDHSIRISVGLPFENDLLIHLFNQCFQ